MDKNLSIMILIFLLGACSSIETERYLTPNKADLEEVKTIGVFENGPMSYSEKVIIKGNKFEIEINSDLEVTNNDEKILGSGIKKGKVYRDGNYLIFNYDGFKAEKRLLVKISNKTFLMDELSYALWCETKILSPKGIILIKK